MRDKCDKHGCYSGLKTLCAADISKFLKGLERGWWIKSPTGLTKKYDFENFVEPLGFVIKIAEIAEKMNHHPSIQLEWGKVTVETRTHSVNGLTELDFALAKEIDYIV